MIHENKKITILVIDDEEVLRLNMRYFLEDSDYIVIEAENGEIGLQQIEKEDIDLVFCDLRMPGMDGLEVLKNIQKEYPELPVIMVSGVGRMSDVIEALRSGAWDYITKPIEDMTILNFSIEKALEKSRLLKDNLKYKKDLESRIERKDDEFKLTLQSINHMVYRVYKDDKGDYIISLCEGKIATELGFSTDLVGGKKVAEIFSKDLFLLLQEKFEIAFRDKEVKFEYEYEDKWYFAILTPYSFNPQGEVIEIIGSVSDVTKQKKVEQSLSQAAKMEAVGTLAGGIAHDFNNILSGILGYADLLLLEVDENSEIYENLEQIKKAGIRASELVRQILVFSRQNEQENKASKIQKIINEDLNMMQGSLPSAVEIKSDIDENCSAVLINAVSIHQVVVNLCTNAFYAMKDNGGLLEIKLREVDIQNELISKNRDVKNGIYAKLTIKDNGSGMEEDIVEKVFEPYFTTKGVGKGTGLGLSTVYGIVSKHNGYIELNSKLGEGTTFNLYFPVTDAEADCMEEKEQNLKSSKGKGNVLYVDDEPMIIEIGSSILQKMGYEITIKEDGLAALEEYYNNRDKYDIIITDFKMPELSGLELIRKIREKDDKIPIILCTGFSNDSIENEVDRLNVELETKPLVFKNMLKKIEKLLKEYKCD